MAEEATARGIRSTGYSVSPDARTLGVITRLIDDGAIRVHVQRELPLEEGAAAHRMLEGGHVRGKVVLRVAPDPD
jgi:NADPH:quinone reductase-like Zn-dependent oxidoreductase